MNLTKKILSIALAMCSLFADAYVSSGEYYIVNDFFLKALCDDGTGGVYLSEIKAENDEMHIFEAVNTSGDFVMLRNKATGKYLTASTSNTWGIELNDEGTGDQYYWRFAQQFSTTLVSKKNTERRVGCDFKSGNTYYWDAEFVPVYYDKGVSAMNWFSIIPANGEGYESSRKATKTDVFTNEYGVDERDVYCITEDMTVQGADLHVISPTPFDGGSVNISGDGYWLILDNVRPSQVDLSDVRISGSPAEKDYNCRVEMYLRGAAIIPISGYPFKAYGDKGTFNLELGNNKDLGEYNNSMHSFTLKRGYMATIASGTNGEGYSRVYVADHDDLDIDLPKPLDGRVSSVNIRNWHYTSKSGYAGGGDRSYATVRCGASWYWNWDANQGSTADVEYIPIKQHLYWPGDGNFYKQNSTAMMMFNEPEHSEQHTNAKCSCGGTIDAWKAYENTGKFNATGLRIGSPSATDLSYIKDYDKHCDDMRQRCDFNCTHGYWTGEWANCLRTLEGFGKPIWITEWEWGASWTSGSNPANANDARDKVLGILDMLEYNDYVERYSYYEWDTGGSNGWMRELFWENNASKGLAYVGQIYERVKPHLGYKASIQPVPNWWAPSFETPSIKQVTLANGKYVIDVSNNYGDATDKLTLMVKSAGGSWQALETIDRSALDNTKLLFVYNVDEIPDDCQLKVVISSVYESSTKESEEYAINMDDMNAKYPSLDNLSNLLFDEGSFISKGVLTYEKDIANKSTQTARMQEVDSWAMGNENGDARAAAMYQYGASYALGGADYVAPKTNSEGNSEGGALGLVSVWTAKTLYTQNVMFPAGKYTITIPVYNSGGKGEMVKNLIGFVEADGTEHYANTTSYAENKWTTETIELEFSGQTTGYLSLGYEAANAGSGSMPHLFFDYVKITDGTNTWPKEPAVYTIKFVDAEGNVISEQSYKENATVTPPDAPKREGYTFEKWNNEVTSATADAEYVAIYSINSYNLTYKVDGEIYGEPALVEYGAPITPVENPTKDGYTFSGWSEIPETMPAKDVTIEGTFTSDTPGGTEDVEPEVPGDSEDVDPDVPGESGDDNPDNPEDPEEKDPDTPDTPDNPEVSVPATTVVVKPVAYYTTSGTPLSAPRKGINLVRMSNGEIRKVFIK